jgi:acyl carrier protein
MTTPISSATAQGVPHRCPLCDTQIAIPPSQRPGDTPCPHCGNLLWFIRTPTGVLFYASKAIAPLREKIIDIIRQTLVANTGHIRPSTSLIEDLRADSLDLVELAMNFEDAFAINWPDDEGDVKTAVDGTKTHVDQLMRIKTVSDVVDFILQHRSK